MQSNRIKSIQRRAKRRILALAIVTTAFVGYNALALFAEEDRPIQLPVAKLSTAPGVKAVGIRLITANGKSLAPTTNSAQTTDAAPTLTNGGPSLLLPPSPSLPTGSSLPPNKVDTALPPPSTPFVGSTSRPTQSTSGFSSLMPPPPPMSEVLASNPNGKVVVKLGSSLNTGKSHNQNTGLANLLVPSQSETSEDSVGIRVILLPSWEPTTKMPPILIEGTAKGSVETNEQTDLMSTPAPVRITVGDSKNKTQSPYRTPQIVKSKPTQITHSVVLAQSTDLDVPNSESQSSDIGSMAEIDTSSVPNTISIDVVDSGSKSGNKLQVPVAVKDAVQDPIHSQVSPSSTSATVKSEAAKSEAIDLMRRKFDARVTSQSPVATVELECLAATTMSLSGILSAVAVQDEKICKILHNDRTVSLVGNQIGSTLVQIWTVDLGDNPQVIRVNVSQPWGNVQATRSEVKDIKQVIAQNFPRADVSIIGKEDGGIEVRGTTDSEDSARRILELVRKLYLVPVIDKVTVSN